MNQENNFPQFRKLSNGRSYYEIISLSKMREVRRTDKRWSELILEASILPERVLILDLIQVSHDHYQIVSEEEFNLFLEYCKHNLEKSEF